MEQGHLLDQLPPGERVVKPLQARGESALTAAVGRSETWG